MTYKIAAGHDNAAGLVTVTPQPSCEGPYYAREVNAVSGLVYDDGWLMADWRYGPELDASAYTALLTTFGLATAKTALVTVSTVSLADRTVFETYNATIVRPQTKYARGFYRDVVFRLIKLEEVA